MNAIEIKGLKKNYGDFTLGPIDLTLPQGCIMGLIGENGAGKSTTIKAMLGMISAGGSIRLLGKDIGGDPAALKQDIGVVPDEIGLPEMLQVRHVEKIMRDTFTNWRSDVFADYIKRFNLPEKKAFKTFSKGMKMKLGIAIALSHEAKLLILDEPTSGLDPLVRDEIVGILNDFTRDESHAILISSHIVSDLEKICDYIAFLHKGKLMLCEEKDRLLEQYGVLQTTPDVLNDLEDGAVIGKALRVGVNRLKTSEHGAGLEFVTVDDGHGICEVLAVVRPLSEQGGASRLLAVDIVVKVKRVVAWVLENGVIDHGVRDIDPRVDIAVDLLLFVEIDGDGLRLRLGRAFTLGCGRRRRRDKGLPLRKRRAQEEHKHDRRQNDTDEDTQQVTLFHATPPRSEK